MKLIFLFKQQRKPWAGQRHGWGWCCPVTTQPGLASSGSWSDVCQPPRCHGNGDGSWPQTHGWGTRRAEEAGRRPGQPLGPKGQEVVGEGQGLILSHRHLMWRCSVWESKRKNETVIREMWESKLTKVSITQFIVRSCVRNTIMMGPPLVTT